MSQGLPTWADRRSLERKFRQHRRDFTRQYPYQPLADATEYERRSYETIREGIRFTYTDSESRAPRVGYFDPLTGRFTAVTDDDRIIVTHFPADDDYVRTPLDSDYP